MADSIDIFKALCDGLIKGLQSTSVRKERWFKNIANDCKDAEEQYAENCNPHTRDICIKTYTDCISTILSHRHAITSLPNIKPLLETFYKVACNQIKDSVFHEDIDGKLSKKWIEENKENIANIIKVLPKEPEWTGSKTVVMSGIIGLATTNILHIAAPQITIPTFMLLGYFAASLDNIRKQHQFENTFKNANPILPRFKGITDNEIQHSNLNSSQNITSDSTIRDRLNRNNNN